MDSDKCIVLTGCSKGLGRFIMEQLLKENFKIIGCARNRPNITHPNFFFYKCDLGSKDSVEEFVAYIKQQKFDVGALINNAAIGALNQFLTTPIDKVQEVMQANYQANYFLSREMAKIMTKGLQGRIVHIGSQTVLLKTPLEAAYAASKAAVETMMKISAKELAPFGITVNMISPGVMQTDIIKGVPKARIDYMLNQQAINQPLKLSDVWNAVRFILSDESSRITGQNIYIGVV
ncbi:MAG: SDR family oxidoreductase [Bacteroidia bacterium]